MKNKKEGIARKILEMLSHLWHEEVPIPFFIAFLVIHIFVIVLVIWFESYMDYQLWTGYASSSVLQLLACIAESSATILGIFLGVMLYLIQTKQYEITRQFG